MHTFFGQVVLDECYPEYDVCLPIMNSWDDFCGKMEGAPHSRPVTSKPREKVGTLGGPSVLVRLLSRNHVAIF